MGKLICRLFHYRRWTTPRRDDQGCYMACLVCGRRIHWYGLWLDGAAQLHHRQIEALIQGNKAKAEDEIESWYRRHHE